MQFVPFEDGIEVIGLAVRSVLDGFSQFAVLASAYLLDEGIGRPGPSGVAHLELDAWYSQQAWLLCFQQISQQLGDGVVTQIGMAIPRNAAFPQGTQDIHSALKSLDVAYHMNHRKHGRPMFDPGTGHLEEGIGHYGYEPVPGQRRIITVSATPYPCAFDMGLLMSLCRRYERSVRVTHDEKKPCRKNGGPHCTYVITW